MHQLNHSVDVQCNKLSLSEDTESRRDCPSHTSDSIHPAHQVQQAIVTKIIETHRSLTRSVVTVYIMLQYTENMLLCLTTH